MPVVTVSRLYGSGGSRVAARVATELGWTLLDSAFVERVAASLRATPAQVQAIEERVPSLAERIADALALGSAEIVSAKLDAPLPPTEERLVEVTRGVIEDEVRRGPVVIVGRGAPAALATRTDALHVFCCAPHESLVATVMAREHVPRDRAEHLVQDTNRQRAQYVRRYFERDWRDAANYDLCVNTSTLGVDGAADLIVHIARQRFQ
jgi:cytidylate kinase